MVCIRPTAVYKFYSFSTDPQRFYHIIMLLSADYQPCNITSNRAILPEKLICKNSHFPSMYTDFFNEKVGYFTVSGTASLNMKIFPIYPHPTARISMISHPVCQCHFCKTYPNVAETFATPAILSAAIDFHLHIFAHQAAITHYSLRRFPFP